jgi:hypothetical protein
MREYARKNPKHHFGERLQDPNGVHAWLEEVGSWQACSASPVAAGPVVEADRLAFEAWMRLRHECMGATG